MKIKFVKNVIGIGNKGEIKEVEYSPMIKKLIDLGAIVIIEGSIEENVNKNEVLVEVEKQEKNEKENSETEVMKDGVEPMEDVNVEKDEDQPKEEALEEKKESKPKYKRPSRKRQRKTTKE